MSIQRIKFGHTQGLQVRVGQGPGRTKYLACNKHGGEEGTWREAQQVEKALLA